MINEPFDVTEARRTVELAQGFARSFSTGEDDDGEKIDDGPGFYAAGVVEALVGVTQATLGVVRALDRQREVLEEIRDVLDGRVSDGALWKEIPDD